MPKENITIRLEADTLDRLDRAAAKMAKLNPGLEVNRAAAIRAAISLGLDHIETEYEVKRGKGK